MTAHDLKLLCPAYTMLRNGHVCEACRGGKVSNVLRHRCIKGSTLGSVAVLAVALLHRMRQTYQRSLARIVVPSRFYFEKFVSWGWSESQLVYIPNFGPEVSAAANSPELPAASEPILYAGRLSLEKGVSTLVRAAARAGVSVEIAGDGPARTIIETLARDLAAPVTFLGRLTGAEVQARMMRARAAVLPSEWYENAPLSVLEAFAAG
ncbi:MAG: glycosyltransferase, partial [Alphaproteobacteria bacterium]